MGLFDRPTPAPAPTPIVTPARRSSTTLSAEERDALTKCETVVTNGIKAFGQAGRALQMIRDKQLYRETAPTFEQYVADRWNISRAYADRLIAAAEVCANLPPTGVMPESERQVRPLASLPPEQQRAAWSEAVEASNGGPVTAAAVEAAVGKRKRKPKRAKVAKPTRFKVPGATVIVIPNKAFSGSVVEALNAAIAKHGEQVPARQAA